MDRMMMSIQSGTAGMALQAGTCPVGQAIMRLVKATPKSTRASTGSSSCPTPSVVSVVKLRDLDSPVICSFLPLRIVEASHIWNFWS